MVFAFAFLILESSVKIRMLLNSFLMNICKYKINSWKNKRRCLAALNKSHKIQRNERVRGIVLKHPHVWYRYWLLYTLIIIIIMEITAFSRTLSTFYPSNIFIFVYTVLTFATENSVQPFWRLLETNTRTPDKSNIFR